MDLIKENLKQKETKHMSSKIGHAIITNIIKHFANNETKFSSKNHEKLNKCKQPNISWIHVWEHKLFQLNSSNKYLYFNGSLLFYIENTNNIQQLIQLHFYQTFLNSIYGPTGFNLHENFCFKNLTPIHLFRNNVFDTFCVILYNLETVVFTVEDIFEPHLKSADNLIQIHESVYARIVTVINLNKITNQIGINFKIQPIVSAFLQAKNKLQMILIFDIDTFKGLILIIDINSKLCVQSMYLKLPDKQVILKCAREHKQRHDDYLFVENQIYSLIPTFKKCLRCSVIWSSLSNHIFWVGCGFVAVFIYNTLNEGHLKLVWHGGYVYHNNHSNLYHLWFTQIKGNNYELKNQNINYSKVYALSMKKKILMIEANEQTVTYQYVNIPKPLKKTSHFFYMKFFSNNTLLILITVNGKIYVYNRNNEEELTLFKEIQLKHNQSKLHLTTVSLSNYKRNQFKLLGSNLYSGELLFWKVNIFKENKIEPYWIISLF